MRLPALSGIQKGKEMEQFNTVLGQETIFLITILIGFGAFKLRLLDSSSLPVLSQLFSNVTLPFLIFVNAVEGASRKDLFASLYVLLIEIALYIVLIFFNKLIIRLFRIRGNSGRIYLMCASFGNMGFVGIPLILSVYGQHAMIYISLFTLVDQLMVWSYGVSLSYPADSGEARLRLDPGTLKRLINPPLIATAFVLVFLLLDLKLPPTVGKALTSLSNASIPIPFLYVGGMLALGNVGQMLKKWPVYLIIFTKMLVLPVIVFLVLRLFPLPGELVGVFVIMAGLPCMAIAPMLARQNGSDELLATSATTLTTLASLFTVPIVSYVTSVLL